MKVPTIILLISLNIGFSSASAQVGILVGDWQLVEQSRCEELATDQSVERRENLHSEVRSRGANASSGVVSFKPNSTGEESVRLLNSGKSANPKKFFYKFNGDMLLILDKKSQTISDSYLVDKFTADSLIISNASRPCEIMIFTKITARSPN